MRYLPHEQFLETHGHQESAQFTIAATGKAFRNLMDGLYSRKIEAVIREICTNAHDSHIEAGIPHVKFEIRFPTQMKRMFSVRDFGVGMPHDQVMTRYSTLFDSTKDTNDSVVGMLGLGSKSPFAYTDGFTLRCWDGQECRTYSSYLGQGGVPTISLVQRVPSSESRGVEVSFPVKTEDVHKFEETAVKVLAAFPNHPVGSEHLRDRLVPEVRDAGDGWATVSAKFLHGDIFALQGCVFYPVKPHEFLEDREIRELGNVNYTLLMDFPVGSLNFVPSREELSYDDHTKASLRRIWANFKDDCTRRIEEKFQGASTDWEIARRVDELGWEASTYPMFSLTRYGEIQSRIHDILNELLPRDDYAFRYGGVKKHFALYDSEGRLHWNKSRKGYARLTTGGHNELLFVTEAPLLRDRRSRILNRMKETNSFHAVVVTNEAVRDGRWTEIEAQLGGVTLLDTEKLEPAPKIVYERDPYVRYQRIEEKETLGGRIRVNLAATTEEDPDFKSATFMFLRGDDVVRPHVTEPVRAWTKINDKSEIIRFHRLTRQEGDPPLFFIRMRTNEKFRRFRKLRLYDKEMTEVIQKLTDRQVMIWTYLRNRELWKGTEYQELWENWRRIKDRPETPFDTLEKWHVGAGFTKTFTSTIKDEEVTRIRGLETFMTASMREMLIARAEGLGLPLFPERKSSWNTTEQTIWPLLPWRWMSFMRMLGRTGLLGGRLSRHHGGGQDERPKIVRRLTELELNREAAEREKREREGGYHDAKAEGRWRIHVHEGHGKEARVQGSGPRGSRRQGNRGRVTARQEATVANARVSPSQGVPRREEIFARCDQVQARVVSAQGTRIRVAVVEGCEASG